MFSTMSYKITNTTEEGKKQLQELVEAFERERNTFVSSSYKETPLRNDFLDIFLMCFGWDVNNEKGQTQFLRDVLQEESIEVEDDVNKKNPDYTLRINGIRKLFVEAKKPSVDVESSKSAAFQTRRYGWNANMGISVLSNFDKLVIYDCRHKPSSDEDTRVARVKVIHCSEYIDKFEEIDELIGYRSVNEGILDDLFSVIEPVGETFDKYFLTQIESWRERLSVSAVQLNSFLTSDDVNFLIQRLLNRIVFLRICEDRTIERFETLKEISDYNALKRLFQQSDTKYNSGLFDFIEDSLSLHIQVDDEVLIGVFQELYYPLSPYNFSVVDPAILSQIYEKFLGSKVTLDDERNVSVVVEPEVVASNGVVPTPKLIVEQIVTDTLSPLVSQTAVDDLSNLRIADICCGSGTFLISAYDFLLKASLEKFSSLDSVDSTVCHKLSDGTLTLTLHGKRQILEDNLFGVDVNPYATEVTEFSLLLKLLEGETSESVNHFIRQHKQRVLPSLGENIKCGNSLVSEDKFFEYMPEAIDDNALLLKVKPFTWETEFPFLADSGGFDAILGNPPYVRIQNLMKYSPEEVKFYQWKDSGYQVAKKESIDKYYVFIQRAISLLNSSGYLGYIVPHKFFVTKGGNALRGYIADNASIVNITHFGVTQVFPERSTYTAIIVLRKTHSDSFLFRRVNKITPNLSNQGYLEYRQDNYADAPWVFLSPKTQSVFDKLLHKPTQKLGNLANIVVGLQTSADPIYIFEVADESDEFYTFTKNGVQHSVEKAICKDCVYDLSFKIHDTISPNAKIIFPYNVSEDGAEVLSEGVMKNEYPKCFEYLSLFKEKLQKRSISGKDPSWYQYGRSQSLTKFHNADKLIWPVLSTEASYVLDESDIQFTGGGNGPYYALTNNSGYSLKYFLGILSNPLFENLIKSGASEFRGAYYSHGKQFIENLPIRDIDTDNAEENESYQTIVELVDSLISVTLEIKRSVGGSRTVLIRKKKRLHDTLIETVNLLYGITREDYDAVINDPMFSQELNENA